MAIEELNIRCANWRTSIRLDREAFDKRSDMCIEAMTVAIENWCNGEHGDFRTDVETENLATFNEEKTYSLDRFISCYSKAGYEICLTESILINAGRYDVVRWMQEQI